MTTKAAFISTILVELRNAQTEKWEDPTAGRAKRISFPPQLWLGDGRSIRATDALLDAISAYTRICWENDPALKLRIKLAELANLTRQSFAQALVKVDLDQSDDELHPLVSEWVRTLLDEQIERLNRPADLTLGCDLVAGDEPFPIHVGPVLFETREAWRQRMLAAGKLSPTTARRLSARWNGKLVKKRKRSFDSMAEVSILDAIGNCPVVCSVATAGLSGNYVQEKGLLAARIAMTALSLTWYQPSEGLRWMKLLYDRRRSHRHVVMFSEGMNVGSNSERAEMPAGRYVDKELVENFASSRWLFDQVGEALYTYVQPNRPIVRPKVMNALFLSLWWYHEACREPLDQIATTKFAASMDTLTGGKKAKGIVALIGARLGHKPDEPLMKDGRTTRDVIGKIYNAGRSQLMHGSSDDFAHDWTRVRGDSEAIGRLLLVTCCQWISKGSLTAGLCEMAQPDDASARIG